MLLIATATHVVSLGAAALVVVATVSELLPADVVGVPKTKVPLLLVVQLIGGPDTMVVNKDDEVVNNDEVVVSRVDVEALVGNEMTIDVVLTTGAELECPLYEANALLYICRQKPISALKLPRYSLSSKKLWYWGWDRCHMDGVFQPVQ
jgi:hypothetical protein